MLSLQVILKALPDDNLKEGGIFADFGTDDPVPAESCAICLVDYEQGDRVVTSNCQHVFHRDCMAEWVLLNMDCPCCRELFVDPDAASVRPMLELDNHL